jgi:competence protein ComEC
VSADLRLALPVGVAWIAAAVLLAIPAALAPAAIVAWAVAALCATAAVLSRRRVASAVLAVLVVAAGAVGLVLGVAAAHLDSRSPKVLLQAASAGRFVHATAVTTQTVQPGAPRFTATLDSVTIGGRALGVSAPVTVFAASPAGKGSTPTRGARLGIGTTILLGGTMAATGPGDDVSFLFFASSPPSVSTGPPWYLAWADGLRAGFADAAAALPGDGGGLLPGLAIGDTSAVDPTLGSAMKSSSLRRLLVTALESGHSRPRLLRMNDSSRAGC